MPTIIPMPIPIHCSGHSRPITEEESKVMLGVFIILSIIFVILSIISIVKYKNREYEEQSFIDFYLLEGYFISIMIKLLMLIVYVIMFLVYLGSLIAKLL